MGGLTPGFMLGDTRREKALLWPFREPGDQGPRGPYLFPLGGAGGVRLGVRDTVCLPGASCSSSQQF